LILGGYQEERILLMFPNGVSFIFDHHLRSSRGIANHYGCNDIGNVEVTNIAVSIGHRTEATKAKSSSDTSGRYNSTDATRLPVLLAIPTNLVSFPKAVASLRFTFQKNPRMSVMGLLPLNRS